MKKEHIIIKVSLSRTTRAQRLKFLQDFIATGVAELKHDCSNCKNKLRCLTKDDKDDLDSNPSYKSVSMPFSSGAGFTDTLAGNNIIKGSLIQGSAGQLFNDDGIEVNTKIKTGTLELQDGCKDFEKIEEEK